MHTICCCFVLSAMLYNVKYQSVFYSLLSVTGFTHSTTNNRFSSLTVEGNVLFSSKSLHDTEKFFMYIMSCPIFIDSPFPAAS